MVVGRCSLVWPVDILDRDDGQVAVVTEITEGDASSGLDALAVYRFLRHVERDGDTEEIAIGEAVVGDDAGCCQAKFPRIWTD